LDAYEFYVKQENIFGFICFSANFVVSQRKLASQLIINNLHYS